MKIAGYFNWLPYYSTNYTGVNKLENLGALYRVAYDLKFDLYRLYFLYRLYNYNHMKTGRNSSYIIPWQINLRLSKTICKMGPEQY